MNVTRRGILRSTPMRLTLLLVVLFALVSLVSLGLSYLVIRNALDQASRLELQQELAGFQAAPSAGALAALIEAEAAVTDPEVRVLSYLTPEGRYFGNGIVTATETGFQVIALKEGEVDTEWPYLALTATLHGGQLTIARSQAQIGDLGELFLNVLLFSLVPTIVIALASGVWLAHRSGRRIDALSLTLDRLTTGDLSARVPRMPGRNDDLSDIAARVDRMAAAQQTSVSALKQVSADIAHDLKTPIQRVSVLLDQARETPGISAELDDLVSRAKHETSGIVATFQSLLQIAQIEGGSPKARFAPLDLGQLAATLVEVYEPAAEESRHRIGLRRASRSPAMVNGDRGLLGQMIANLIENALRHTPAQSAITVSVESGQKAVTLTVADNGPGIPEAEREKVLRRLYRLEQSRTTPGSGLGLSLVSVVAELHDAKLELASNFPGLRVQVTFPAMNGFDAAS